MTSGKSLADLEAPAHEAQILTLTGMFGGTREIDAKLLSESGPDPALCVGDGAKRHGLPSNPFDERFPHARQRVTVISGRSHREEHAGHGVGGDGCILRYHLGG
jgi:hypothetical protein